VFRLALTVLHSCYTRYTNREVRCQSPQYGRIARVARQPTKPRPVRMTDDLWKRALATAEAADENLPDAIRDYVAWYARVPGARPPRRPAAQRND
jgi:hypothetical protein